MRKLLAITLISNPVKIVVITIFLMASLSVLNTTKYVENLYHNEIKKLKEDAATYDFRIDFNDNFASLYKDEKIVDNLKDMHEKLSASEHFKYYEVYSQFMYLLGYKGPAQFKYGYEGGFSHDGIVKTSQGMQKASANNCVQLSLNCFETFHLEIEEGRSFTQEDYQYSENSKELPILLGYEYKNHYSIGDIMQGVFMGKELNLKVVGFLREDSRIKKAESFIYLDRYIVMPSFNCIDETISSQDEKLFQIRFYANKTSGYLKINNGITYVSSIIQEICESCNLKMYYVGEVATSVNVRFMSLSGTEMANAVQYVGYALTFTFWAVFSIMYALILKLKTKTLLCFMISGMELSKFCNLSLLFAFIILVIANLSAVLTTFIIYKQVFYHVHIFLVSVLVLLSCFAIIRYLTDEHRISRFLWEENKNAY